MKKSLLSLCCLTVLSFSHLFAQVFVTSNPPSPSLTPPLDQSTNLLVHIGDAPDRFSIGSADRPITVSEYCAFLNQVATTRYCYRNPASLLITIDYPSVNNYYDDLLMNRLSPQYCIIRSVYYPRTSNYQMEHLFGRYSYCPKEGSSNFIIDALNAEYAQKGFNAFLDNESSQ